MDRSRFQQILRCVISLAILILFTTVTANAAVDVEVLQKKFVNANIVLHKKTGIPFKIVGLKYKPIALKTIGAPITKNKVVPFFNAFLQENKKILAIEPDNLKLVSQIKRKNTWYVKYQQYYKNIPIINATVGLGGNENGEIINYAASYQPKVDVSLTVKINKEQAIKFAKQSYGKALLSELSVRKIEKVVYPDKSAKTVKYYLAWRIDILTKTDRVKNDKILIVDAVTGKILHQYPSRFYGAWATGTVRGEVYPENPTDTVATVPIIHSQVQANGTFWNGSANSNSSGAWKVYAPWWANIFRGYTARFALTGPYAHVEDTTGTSYTAQRGCNVGTACNFTWTDTDRDHINVFHHLNLIHDWYINQIAYSWVNPWTGTSRFNAEVNGAFNNAYAGDPMSFGNNPYARSSDVVYHEATHNVLYALYGDYVGWPAANSEAYAFDEGFADYYASAITDDPRHGEGYGGTRTLSNTNQYSNKSTYNTEGHTGGTIIAGAAWDLRGLMQAKMGNVAGANFNDNLMFDAHIIMATSPRNYYFSDPQESNFLSSLYLAVDDNANLLDGFPHFSEIQQVFSNHNLLQAQLTNRDSYDVSTNSIGTLSGGDFYFSDDAFWANNVGQRGVRNLGNVGTIALEDVTIPSTGYSRQRVNAVLNNTYVSLAQAGEEGSFIVFRVTEFSAANDTATIQYLYRTPVIAMADLQIMSILVQPRQPRIGQTATFTITVKNSGTAAAGVFSVSVKIGNAEPILKRISDLAPNQNRALTHLKKFTRDGTYQVRVTADSTQAIEESNEGNNSKTVSVRVIGFGGECSSNADCPRGGTCCEPATPNSYCVTPPRVCR